MASNSGKYRRRTLSVSFFLKKIFTTTEEKSVSIPSSPPNRRLNPTFDPNYYEVPFADEFGRIPVPQPEPFHKKCNQPWDRKTPDQQLPPRPVPKAYSSPPVHKTLNAVSPRYQTARSIRDDPPYHVAPDSSGHENTTYSYEERYYKESIHKNRRRTVSFNGTERSPAQSFLKSRHSLQISHSALRDRDAPGPTRRRHVSFGLVTDLAPELVVPVEAFSLRSRALNEQLLSLGYDLIPATPGSAVYKCVVKIKDFPWYIEFERPEIGYANERAKGLTVFDILSSIQRSLFLEEEKTDYEPNGPLYKYRENGPPKEVWDAYHKRVRQHRLLECTERVRRIDWLKGRYYFQGLQDLTQSGEWKLMVGRCDE